MALKFLASQGLVLPGAKDICVGPGRGPCCMDEWMNEPTEGKDSGGGWRRWPAFLRTRGKVFLLLESSLPCAHTVFSGFPPFFPGHSFCLVCRPIILHLAAKHGSSSRWVFGPSFLCYTHYRTGFNLALSFRCHLHAINSQTIFTPILSELRPLNPTRDLLCLLGFLKFSTHPRQNSGSSLFPQTGFPAGLISYLPHIPLQSPGNSSLPSPLEPMHDQVCWFCRLSIWWQWQLPPASPRPKLPSSLIWTCNK